MGQREREAGRERGCRERDRQRQRDRERQTERTERDRERKRERGALKERKTVRLRDRQKAVAKTTTTNRTAPQHSLPHPPLSLPSLLHPVLTDNDAFGCGLDPDDGHHDSGQAGDGDGATGEQDPVEVDPRADHQESVRDECQGHPQDGPTLQTYQVVLHR